MSEHVAKHTSGPWSMTVWAEHMPHAGTVASIYGMDENGEDDEEICKMDQLCDPVRRLANAHLIKAAPRMLAALKRQHANIQRWLETGEPAGADESREIAEQIEAAIDAAEGRL